MTPLPPALFSLLAGSAGGSAARKVAAVVRAAEAGATEVSCAVGGVRGECPPRSATSVGLGCGTRGGARVRCARLSPGCPPTVPSPTNPPPAPVRSLKTNPIDAIVQRVREGPLLLLKACYQQRSRVRVVTRHAHGVRGASEGTLVAFDRYLNLVLRDVEEQYTVLLRVQRPRPPGPGEAAHREGREPTLWRAQHALRGTAAWLARCSGEAHATAFAARRWARARAMGAAAGAPPAAAAPSVRARGTVWCSYRPQAAAARRLAQRRASRQRRQAGSSGERARGSSGSMGCTRELMPRGYQKPATRLPISLAARPCKMLRIASKAARKSDKPETTGQRKQRKGRGRRDQRGQLKSRLNFRKGRRLTTRGGHDRSRPARVLLCVLLLRCRRRKRRGCGRRDALLRGRCSREGGAGADVGLCRRCLLCKRGCCLLRKRARCLLRRACWMLRLLRKRAGVCGGGGRPLSRRLQVS